MLKVKKRVSFSLKQTAYFSPEQQLSREERKSECWYSESELNVSRDEARMAIQAMQHQLQLDAAAAAAQATTSNIIEPVTSAAPLADEIESWILRCPEDETKIVCLRGIEKYADAAAKYAGQKRLVNSVLQQQSRNNEDIHVALVSQTLSKPFKDVARYYAMKSAEELVLSRKHEAEQEETERKQREEVATVLLLIMGQENNQKQQEDPKPVCKTPSQPPNPKLQESSSVVTPRGSLSGKRSFTNSPLCESRNVKPCVRRISE
jgi:DNA polymerase III alpha subunit